MRVKKLVLGPSDLQSNEDLDHELLFQDFERSKIELLRDLLTARPFAMSAVYFAVLLLWTGVLSYGSSLQPDVLFATDMTPHVAQILLVVGLLIYPRRWLWVPALAYCAIFPVAFYTGSSMRIAWAYHPFLTVDIVRMHFALHVVSGLTAGLAVRWASAYLHRKLSPYKADLITCAGIAIAFTAFTLPVSFGLQGFAAQLPAPAQLALGFQGSYIYNTTVNTLLNGAAMSTMLLTVMARPNSRQFGYGMLAAGLFPLTAYAQLHGYGMFPGLDVCMLGLFLVFTVPIPVALVASLIGFPVYAAMTGTFLAHHDFASPEQLWLQNYAIIAVWLTVYAIIQHDLSRHNAEDRASSMRRMNRVRDFADVGLLSFNLSQGRYRCDGSASRILGLPQQGPAQDLIHLFKDATAEQMAAALRVENTGSITLLLERTPEAPEDSAQVLRLFLWFETAPSKERVAYGLVLDTTRDHQQAATLRETLQSLESRKALQQQLFSIISHELRTPAAVISMLLDELDRPENLTKTRRQLRDATDQLLATLADMRQAVNPQQNLPIRRLPYAPAELAESIRNMLEPQAQAAGMKLKIVLGPDAHRARLGDTARLRQAITNLVRNAIIHSKGTEIRISFHARADVGTEAPVSVWKVIDNGIGIPPAEVERMFQPFERGGDDPRKQADGSGLGLFISKTSIEMLGGTLEHFAPLNGGSGYKIELPEQLALAADQTFTAPQAVPEAFPTVYILLAEDNKLVAEVTHAQLSRFVGRVDVVENGIEALERIASARPDILITDLFMPEMDGDELVKALRARGETIPVIGLTAAVVGDDMERFHHVGVQTVMSKPIDMATLRRTILTLLSPSEPTP